MASLRLLLPLLALPLLACGDISLTGGDEVENESDTIGEHTYQAQIRRTSHGVAHITAADWGSLSFGQGYAFTEDKGCLLLDQIIKVRSQRARWFGPGEGNQNIYSDIAYLQLHTRARAEEQFPLLDAQIREIITGYAAGVNLAISEGKLGGTCDGADWLPTSIDAIDLFSYYLDLALLASGRQAIDAIGSAQPPGGGNAPPPAPPISSLVGHRGVIGSNGWGIGGELSASGGGMLLANPHFPWEGELQLWETHLVIPGEFEIYGVGLLGVPGVLIGFNDQVAWTHTVSDGHRLTIYQIESPDGEPTKYLYDGEVRDMIAETFTIDVLQGDGSVKPETRTQWSTHYGPMLALDPFYWTDALALSARDANIDNYRLIEQFLRMSTSTSLEEFQQVHAEVSGIPWVNTIATSADGRAWYMDDAATPNLSQEAIDAWYQRKDSGFTKAFADQDIWLLEGNNSRDEWQDDPGARSPGLVAPAHMPDLERTDFVFNANDSYWMSNPKQLLTGFSPLHGFAETPRQLRTRMNARTLLEIADGAGYAGADGKLDLDELTQAALGDRSLTRELFHDDLVARCTGVDVWELDGEVVDIAEACDLLAAWDGRLDLDSIGAIVWREWIGDYDYKVTQADGVLFSVPFDPADPVETPNTLSPANNGNDRALDALAAAVLRLDQAGLALDTPLGEAQYTRKGELQIPMHGGNRHEGLTNLIVRESFRSDLTEPVPYPEVINENTGLTAEGYAVNYGTSFIMCLAYGPDGPEARALLSYSQSADPDSPWFADQTQLFSGKQWRPVLWKEADIAADPNLISYDVFGD
ncbi:MAG: penicillin acylase family protein [Myxococcales bacterium]|nr:penicillin acylase family protein [Myxococcales bacterium]